MIRLSTILQMIQVMQLSKEQSMQQGAISWSRDTNMNINASKTKEMLVSFAKEDPSVPKIIIDGDEVKRV